jgi:hypothetical protein
MQKVASPVPGIVSLMYFSKGASGPSCALLLEGATAPALLELSSSDPGETYPECMGIIDAAGFKLVGREYVVFQYQTRETREDIINRYRYVVKDRSGRYQDADELNNTEAPISASPVKGPGDNTPRAREGVAFARTIMARQSMPGTALQTRDYVVDGVRSFAIFQDKARSACTFVVDDGTRSFRYAHTLFAAGDTCTTILAAGKLEYRGATYYIAMFRGTSRVRLAIASVGATGTVTSNDALAIAATSSSLKTMKEAKSAIATALRNEK